MRSAHGLRANGLLTTAESRTARTARCLQALTVSRAQLLAVDVGIDRNPPSGSRSVLFA